MHVTRRRTVSSLAAWTLAGILATPARLAAEVIELPAEIALDGSALTFELADADLAIEVRPGVPPLLRARLAKDEGQSARLEVAAGDGTLTLSRPAAEVTAPRLSITAVMAPGQRLVLRGRRLTLAVDDRPAEPAGRGSTGTADAGARASFQLSLSDSEADLADLRDPVLELTASSAWLAATVGKLDLTLTGGAAEIRGHRGDLHLVARGAEVTIDDHDGLLAPRLVGGSLEIRGGRGKLDATAEEALLRLDGWRGGVRLRGTGTTLEARASGLAAARWQIDGSGLRLSLDEISGPITATLDGGSFDGRDLASKVVAVAKGDARLDLAALGGALQLTLTGAEGRVSDLRGSLSAQLEDARLEADGVGQLALTAARSRIFARRVGLLSKTEVSDSELVLDLDGGGRKPSLKLAGTSRATVRLTPPCLVQLLGATAMVDRQVRLSGCDLLVPGQRLRGRQAFFRYGDSPLTTLRAEVGEDAGLEVEGR